MLKILRRDEPGIQSIGLQWREREAITHEDYDLLPNKYPHSIAWEIS